MSDTTPGADHTPEHTPDPTTPEPAASSVPPASSTPPPAAQPTPPPASSGTPGPSASTSANDAVATLKTADRLDLGTIGAGVLVFLGSLLPYYTVSFEGFGSSASSSANAWHGFFGWFGALAALVAAGLLVAKVLGVALPLPVPVRTLVLGLFGLAVVCTLLALFVTPGGDCDDSLMAGACDMIDQGHGFGYWLALLASIAGLALAAMRRSAD